MRSQLDVVIGRTLHDKRAELGITQTEMARSLHTTQTIVSRVESGRRSIKISEAIMCSVSLKTTPTRLFDEIKQALFEAGLIEGYRSEHDFASLADRIPQRTMVLGGSRPAVDP